MEKFGIKSLAALNVAYFNALVALGKIQDIKSGRKPGKVDNKISINNRGSIVIPKKLVDSLELDESDAFEVVKNGTPSAVKEG